MHEAAAQVRAVKKRRETSPNRSGRSIFHPGRLRHLLLALSLALALFPGLDAEAKSLIGVTREEVFKSLGQPEAAVGRGDREILVFADGTRVEIVDGYVVDFRGSGEPLIVSRDGIRYVLDGNGKLRRFDADPEPPAPGEAGEDQGAPSAKQELNEEDDPFQVHAREMAAAETEAEAEAGSKADAAEGGAAGIDPEEVPAADPVEFIEEFGAFEEEEPLPTWLNAIVAILSFAVRFAVVLLVLRLTLSFMGRPVIYPDLIRTSFLYTAIRDGLHGLGSLDGAWQFIQIFRVDEIVSFIALAVLIFRFGIARKGIIALQIAVATKVVAFFLMIAAGIALTFGLMALQ